MSLEKTNFGSLQGSDVTLYKLTNQSGVEVHLIDYGVTITSILIPNADGTKDNIVCGFNTLEGYFAPEYMANAPFFGCTVGRYCSTIKDAKYGDVKLSVNCAEHNLHGGTVGFDKQIWTLKESSEQSVTFVLHSPDGDQGFPGAVDAEVTIALGDDNALSFKYGATTTKLTPLSMTNHTYYNLSGFRESVEGHSVQINSTTLIPLNSEGRFTSVQRSVAGEADDLRDSKVIGDVHMAMGDGFEHYYLFSDDLSATPVKVAQLDYTPLGRSMEIFTTEQGMLFYTGKFTSDELSRESGEQFGKFRACCFESHRIPNGVNIEGAPNVMLSPDESFCSETIIKLKF